MPHDGEPSHSSVGLPLYETRIAPLEDPTLFSTLGQQPARSGTHESKSSPRSNKEEVEEGMESETEYGNEVESYMLSGYMRSTTGEATHSSLSGLKLLFIVLRFAMGVYGVYFFGSQILDSRRGSDK